MPCIEGCSNSSASNGLWPCPQHSVSSFDTGAGTYVEEVALRLLTMMRGTLFVMHAARSKQGLGLEAMCTSLHPKRVKHWYQILNRSQLFRIKHHNLQRLTYNAWYAMPTSTYPHLTRK
eukprot:6198748-Pleurochrysis_carterae.AAC.3